MITYISCLTFILICRLFYKRSLKSKEKKVLISISLIPVLVLLSLKDASVGADTANYNRMFISSKYDLLDFQYGRLEIGYKIFLNVISSIFNNPQWQFGFIGLFIVLSLGIFLYRYSKEPTISLIFYITLGLFAFSLSGVRQAVAMGICLFSFRYIEDKKLLKFLLIVVLATLFHRSAIFFIPAYLIANRSISKINIIMNIVLSVIVFVFAEPFILSFANFFEISYGIEKGEGGFIFFSLITLITVLSIIYRRKLLSNNSSNMVFINLNFIAFILWGLRLVSRTAERPSFYYLFATIILLEEILKVLGSKRERLLITVFAISLSILLFVYRLYGSPIFPYVFFWN